MLTKINNIRNTY